jgi:hypothetical protein
LETLFQDSGMTFSHFLYQDFGKNFADLQGLFTRIPLMKAMKARTAISDAPMLATRKTAVTAP